MALKPLMNKRPFLKMAFQGFAGDGKTMTAAVVAVGLHKMIKSTKPIAVFDTEKAMKALKPFFDKEKIDVIVDDENRSLKAWNTVLHDCINGAADILITDSVTHIWEDFLNAYMKDKKKSRLEFQDWGILKPRWKEQFSLAFIEAPIHIIFTGRAGYEYENEKNEETGKREIFKSGVKMKAEGETAFEPDILVFMEKHQDILGEKKNIWRAATILKDRTTLIDGMTLNADGKKKGPAFADFAPAIKSLLSGTYVDERPQLIQDTFEDEDRKALERKKKETLIAEVEGNFNLMALGSSAADKQTKAWILKQIWNVTTTDALLPLKVDQVEHGFEIMKIFVDRWIGYMNECRESEQKPDPERVKEDMKISRAMIEEV